MRDPVQYARFSDERSRPFHTLLSRVPERDYRRVVDLGCGSGELTRSISDRWPEATVLGLDSSPQMLERAGEYARPTRLDFRLGDIDAYSDPVDLIFTNAALQWVDSHESLFPRLVSLVQLGGVLAVQMPSSFEQPSHLLLDQTARSGPWADKLSNWRKLQVKPLQWYIDLMMSLGLEVDAWETVYYFVLQGQDPVLQWVKGTSLQPILNLLDQDEQAEFSSVYAAALRTAYPESVAGTIYPFKRIFFVASRPI